MCENSTQCGLNSICVRGECLDASSLHVELSNTTIIVLPIVMSFIFLGVFIGCFVGCAYMARKRQQNLQKETENQAQLQAQAQRQAMAALQNQQYQHPDIPSQYNSQLQSYMQQPDQQPQQPNMAQQGYNAPQQGQFQPQAYQPVPAVGGVDHNQQYYMAQQQLYAGMPQAQQYQMSQPSGPLQGQGIVQPVVGEEPTSKQDPN